MGFHLFHLIEQTDGIGQWFMAVGHEMQVERSQSFGSQFDINIIPTAYFFQNIGQRTVVEIEQPLAPIGISVYVNMVDMNLA